MAHKENAKKGSIKVKDAGSEEMQEFIVELPPESESNDEKDMKTCAEHSGKGKAEKDAPEIKVETLPFKTAGSHLMTKRITIAGGFLDIALFTANCEQLKFVLELGEFHIYYKQVLALLITSLVLQLLIGVTMFLLGCQVTNLAHEETYFNFLNHSTMGLVAIITIVNIFIGTFGPKGTAIARCLGAFAYPNKYGASWTDYVNATRHYMLDQTLHAGCC